MAATVLGAWGAMARIAEERLDAVRKYLHQVFPDWALAERWDDEREAHSFLGSYGLLLESVPPAQWFHHLSH